MAAGIGDFKLYDTNTRFHEDCQLVYELLAEDRQVDDDSLDVKPIA
jgi:hypothetical protein